MAGFSLVANIMTFDSLIQSLYNDPGAMIVGSMWALYVIGGHVMQNWRNTKQQEVVDRGASSLLSSLQTMATTATNLAQQERDRADRLTRENMELNAEIGGLRADLRHLTEARTRLAEELVTSQESVEQLVMEIRNKDRSIEQLVDLNKRLLKSMGSSVDTLEYVSESKTENPDATPQSPPPSLS